MATTTARKRERRRARREAAATPEQRAEVEAKAAAERQREAFAEAAAQRAAQEGRDPIAAAAYARRSFDAKRERQAEERKRASRREREAAIEQGLGLRREGGVVVSRPGLDGAPEARQAHQLEGGPAVEPGKPGKPGRALDMVDAWERSGAISRSAADAARQFRDDFEAAGLVGLRAVDPERSPSGGGFGGLPGGVLERDRVWRVMQALGGLHAPCSVALWHVVGCGESLSDAARRMPPPVTWDRDMVKAVALGAIGALAGVEARPLKMRVDRRGR